LHALITYTQLFNGLNCPILSQDHAVPDAHETVLSRTWRYGVGCKINSANKNML